jgi:hypothetical protein
MKMIEINKDSLDARIVKILLRKYPITLKELREKLEGARKKLLELKLKELQRRKILDFEVLPEKVFIRLLRTDFHFIGEKKTQKKKSLVKKKLLLKKREVGEYEGYEGGGMMYR